MNKYATLFAATATALSIASTNAMADPKKVVVDDDFKTKLFFLEDDFSKERAQVTRAMSDEAIEIYCEWSIAADINLKKTPAISNVEVLDMNCKPLETSDVEQWNGGKSESFIQVFGNKPYLFSYDHLEKTVEEIRQTAPTKLNVTSEMKRTWDFKANQVCLQATEGIVASDPYLTVDYGCYDIPNNKYSAEHKRDLGL